MLNVAGKAFEQKARRGHLDADALGLFPAVALLEVSFFSVNVDMINGAAVAVLGGYPGDPLLQAEPHQVLLHPDLVAHQDDPFAAFMPVHDVPAIDAYRFGDLAFEVDGKLFLEGGLLGRLTADNRPDADADGQQQPEGQETRESSDPLAPSYRTWVQHAASRAWYVP